MVGSSNKPSYDELHNKLVLKDASLLNLLGPHFKTKPNEKIIKSHFHKEKKKLS